MDIGNMPLSSLRHIMWEISYHLLFHGSVGISTRTVQWRISRWNLIFREYIQFNSRFLTKASSILKLIPFEVSGRKLSASIALIVINRRKVRSQPQWPNLVRSCERKDMKVGSLQQNTSEVPVKMLE